MTVTIILWSVTLALNVALWFGGWLLMQHNGTLTPLHYTIYFGIDLTAGRLSAYAIPALGTLMIISHALFGTISPHPMWRRSWLVIALAMHVLLGAALLVLLFVRQV
jgi:hypothetical protein